MLKSGKALGPDAFCPELILHASSALKSWLSKFLSSCMHQLKLPKIWKRALVVAIPKLNKPFKDPKSYRSISLLFVTFKILGKLIYVSIKPIIDPLLPREQARFRHRRSTKDQVTLLTQKIENSFSVKKNTSIVFVDLTAAYNTVWHHDLTCKLLCLLDRHIVSLIMELVVIKVLLSSAVLEIKAGYNTLRMASQGIDPGSPLVKYLHV